MEAMEWNGKLLEIFYAHSIHEHGSPKYYSKYKSKY